MNTTTQVVHFSHCTHAWLLLCTPLPTVTSADNADLNEAVTKLNLRNEMNAYVTLLCKDIIHLLQGAAREPKQKEITPTGEGVSLPDRTTLVEKCLIFYNRLLDFKYRGRCIM